MTFVLEAVRVHRGSALLLHFGPWGDVPSRILIDCGADGSYQDCLRPRLEQLGSPGNDLPLCMVLIGQMDGPHLGEAKALFDDIESGQSPLRPEAIWLNVTSGEQDDPARQIRERAAALGLAINPPFDPPEIRADTNAIAQGHGLSLEVLAPFESPNNRAEAAPIVLARKGDQTMLIAGNAPGPRIVNALVVAGYLDQSEAYPPGDCPATDKAETKPVDDPFHVNLMAITQQEAAGRLTTGFFRRVTADSYLFSGNTTDGNPDVTTLRAIAEARGEDEFNLYFTITANEKGASPSKRAVLDWVENEMPDGCVALFRDDAPGRYATSVELPA